MTTRKVVPIGRSLRSSVRHNCGCLSSVLEASADRTTCTRAIDGHARIARRLVRPFFHYIMKRARISDVRPGPWQGRCERCSRTDLKNYDVKFLIGNSEENENLNFQYKITIVDHFIFLTILCLQNSYRCRSRATDLGNFWTLDSMATTVTMDSRGRPPGRTSRTLQYATPGKDSSHHGL